MHVTSDRLIIEIVDEHDRVQPPEMPGEIVVTNFDTPEMPFIRYRTGDVGALTTRRCSCGRSLPLLERVDGRKTDFIVSPDGRMIHGLALIYLVRELSGIVNFRITQKRLTSFEVEIERNPEYDPRCEEHMRNGFIRRLRAPVEVKVRYVESIAPTANGKTRHIVSEISIPPGIGWTSSPSPKEPGEVNAPNHRGLRAK
jgi:phenylacetate-CoA ligase